MLILIQVALSLFPVLLFLIALVSLDSYKLVGLISAIKTIYIGGVVAIIAFFLNKWLSLQFTDTKFSVFCRALDNVLREEPSSKILPLKAQPYLNPW